MKVHAVQTFDPTRRSAFTPPGLLNSCRASIPTIPAFPALLVLFMVSCCVAENPGNEEMIKRPQAKAYLNMPPDEGGKMPLLLSQIGAFSDLRELRTAEALIPYELNMPFWSDGAAKRRWLSVPFSKGAAGARPGADSGTIEFEPIKEWTFPNGTVLVKHFELAVDETRPEIKRRLETRLLVRDRTGGVYGVTYKWRADNSDAEMLGTNESEAILIHTASGVRTQVWYYPSRADCKTCHTPLAGGVLGINSRQVNRDFQYPSGFKDNQLRMWNRIGLFRRQLREKELSDLPTLAAEDNSERPLQERVRSWLDANCAYCHRPAGTVATFDARYSTPFSEQNLLGGQVLIDEGIDNARVVAGKDIWRSILYMRANSTEAIKMPPLARNEVDVRSMDLVRQWIESLPGNPVLPPPKMSPAGGNYLGSLEVRIKQPIEGATIFYTLDGSVPTKSDTLYKQPIRISGPTVVRAKAYKQGYTKSITAQEVYALGE